MALFICKLRPSKNLRLLRQFINLDSFRVSQGWLLPDNFLEGKDRLSFFIDVVVFGPITFYHLEGLFIGLKIRWLVVFVEHVRELIYLLFQLLIL